MERERERERGDVVDIFPEMDEGDEGMRDVPDYTNELAENSADYIWDMGVVEEYEEHNSGVVGVYSATPEFLAVVPFANSCVSLFYLI